jgi:Dihaem cytochrome c
MPLIGKVKSIFFLTLFLLSLLGGILFASLLNSSAIAQSPSSDTLLSRYEIGQQTYLENCASCHIAIPPSILPTQTWKKLLENPSSHYGIRLKPIIGITQRLIWDYLSYSSRPLTEDTFVPLLIEQSSYLKVLHPRVNLPTPFTHNTCITCHPHVSSYDYRTLTPIWENAP